jgi:hypothetical protein
VVQHANKETQRNLSHSLSLSLKSFPRLPRLHCCSPLLPLGIVHHTDSRVGVALRACDPRPPPPVALGRYSAGAVWRLWAHRHTTRAKRIQAVESRHHTQYGGFTRRPLWEGGEWFTGEAFADVAGRQSECVFGQLLSQQPTGGGQRWWERILSLTERPSPSLNDCASGPILLLLLLLLLE